MSNVKTVTLAADAVTTVRFDSSFPYYWIDNQTDVTIYAAIGAEPVPETDGTFTVAAGGKVRLSGGITPSEIKLLGSGKVQVVASGIAECPFKSAPVSGGGKELTGNSSYTTENTVDYPLIGLSLYGKSTQNGTPTPENPVEIVSVGDSGTVNITANNGADVSVTVEITTALPLCGIPVSSGGNYTDSNGQQWVCDELIYNADGTGKIVKRTEKIKLTSDNVYSYDTNNKRAMHSIQQHIVDGNSLNYTKCNCLIPAHGGGFSYETGGKYYINNQLLFVYTQNFGVETELDWKNYVDNNDVIVYHAVKTPTITELTAAEILRFFTFHFSLFTELIF